MGTAVWDESININPKNTDIKYLNGKGSGASITYNTTWKESGGGTGETVPVSDPITFNSVWANQITSTTAHVQADVTWDGSALTEVGMKWGFSTAMNNDPLTDDVGSVLTKIYYDFGPTAIPPSCPAPPTTISSTQPTETRFITPTPPVPLPPPAPPSPPNSPLRPMAAAAP